MLIYDLVSYFAPMMCTLLIYALIWRSMPWYCSCEVSQQGCAIMAFRLRTLPRTLVCKPHILFFLYFNPRCKHVLFMSVYCIYILVCNTCIIILGQEQLPSLISNTHAICEIRFFHHTSWRDANLIYLTCHVGQ